MEALRFVLYRRRYPACELNVQPALVSNLQAVQLLQHHQFKCPRVQNSSGILLAVSIGPQTARCMSRFIYYIHELFAPMVTFIFSASWDSFTLARKPL